MNKLVLTTLESRYRLYDMRTQHPVHGFSFLSQEAHQSTVWAARHLPQNRDVFMTCGGNGSLELWKYSYPSQRSIKEKDGHEKVLLSLYIYLSIYLSICSSIYLSIHPFIHLSIYIP